MICNSWFCIDTCYHNKVEIGYHFDISLVVRISVSLQKVFKSATVWQQTWRNCLLTVWKTSRLSYFLLQKFYQQKFKILNKVKSLKYVYILGYIVLNTINGVLTIYIFFLLNVKVKPCSSWQSLVDFSGYHDSWDCLWVVQWIRY